MSNQSWSERYATNDCVGGVEPCAFLRDHLDWLPRGRALDVAIGEGRNAAFLIEHGFQVLGVDREPIALERAKARCGPALETLQIDLETGWQPLQQAFELVLVVDYLQRDLFAALEKALKPGGALLYETRTVGNFALQPNELLRVFAGLRIGAYRECQGRASLLAFRET